MGVSNSKININLTKHKYLSGPVSLYYLKKNDQKIFLFGDEHFSLDYACTDKKEKIDFIKFLNTIFLTSDKKIDFLVEASYNYIEMKDSKKKKINLPHHSYLTKVIDYYVKKGCFLSDKINCSKEFPNVRFHSVDYRFSYLCNSVRKIGEIEIYLIVLNFYIQMSVKESFIIKDLDKIIPKIKYISTYEKLEEQINISFNCKKIKKQLDNCDPSIREKILKYKKNEMMNNKKKYQNFYDYNMEQLHKFYSQINKSFSYSILSMYVSNLVSIIISVNCIVMDIYCLSRLFRKYKNNNGDTMMKNVIIYAGAQHIENYLLFLREYMGFDLELGTHATEKRCLDISKLPHLLFKNKK